MLGRIILVRIGTTLLTLLAVSILVFAIVELLPGDIAARVLGRTATPEAKEAFRLQLRLDRPAHERYLNWLGGALRGDLGESLVGQRPVWETVGPRLRNTATLGLYALLLYIPISLFMATLAALRRDGKVDDAISVMTLVWLALPEFVLGTVLLLLFAVEIPLFPPMSLIQRSKSFWDGVRILTLPALTMALTTAPYAIRMLRDNLVEILDSDYVRMATLKGLSPMQVVLHHALPNAIVPALNVTAFNLAYLVGSAVVVEQVFSFPGLGRLLVESIFLRDAPVIEAITIILSGVYIVANLVTDVAGYVLNPRLRTR